MKFITVVNSEPETDREKWLKERRDGLGGSDIGSLMEAEINPDNKYACVRGVYLSKLLELNEADNYHTARGKFFEGPVANLFSEKTERPTFAIGNAYLKDYPYIRSNTDRMQYCDKRKSTGVLEIKCPARYTFNKYLKEGLPVSYMAQLQYQMLCYNVEWGSFAIYCAETHRFQSFDVERDDGIIGSLIRTATHHWEKISSYFNDNMSGIEKRLEPLCRDPVNCKICEKIPGCLIDDSFTAGTIGTLSKEAERLAEDYIEVTDSIKALEESKDEIKAALKPMLSGETSIGNGFKISYKEQSRESVSAKDVRVVCSPEMANALIKESKYSTLRISKLGDKK